MVRFFVITVCLWICTRDTNGASPPKCIFFPPGGQVGQKSFINASAHFESWPVNVAIDDSSILLKPQDEPGKFSLEVGNDASPGIRWVRLFNSEGATPPIPLMIGTVVEICESEPNDLPEQVREQLLRGTSLTINGRLCQDCQDADVDIYAIAIKAGQTLVADLDAHCPLGVPMDGVLQVLSHEGFVLSQNDDDGGLDPRIVYTAHADGTVLVRLFAFPAEPTSDIKLSSGADYVYRLTLTVGPFLDHCFPLAAEQGKNIQVQARGWNFEMLPVMLDVHIPTGQTEQTIFFPTLAGHSLLHGETIRTLVENEPNDSLHPQSLLLPCVVSGRIGEPDDVDAFAAELRKGQAVRVCVDSSRLGFPLDPVLTISSCSPSKELFRYDDTDMHRDAEAVFNAPDDGLYCFTIADVHKRGSWRHAYRLRIETEKDFDVTVEQSEFSVAAGNILEIPVKIDRRLDFGDEIEFFCEDLPMGTNYSPTRSKLGDKSAQQVTITLAAGAIPSNGPLRIKGKSMSATPVERLVHMRESASGRFSSLPWLTILSTK